MSYMNLRSEIIFRFTFFNLLSNNVRIDFNRDKKVYLIYKFIVMCFAPSSVVIIWKL